MIILSTFHTTYKDINNNFSRPQKTPSVVCSLHHTCCRLVFYPVVWISVCEVGLYSFSCGRYTSLPKHRAWAQPQVERSIVVALSCVVMLTTAYDNNVTYHSFFKENTSIVPQTNKQTTTKHNHDRPNLEESVRVVRLEHVSQNPTR